MWSEPLTTDSRNTDVTDDGRVYGFASAVRQRGGTIVATARCVTNQEARTGLCGELRIIDHDGSPQQTRRALVLLMREALRHGADLGIRHAHSEVPDRMLPLVRRLTGITRETTTSRGTDMRGDLHRMRSHALETSDGNGNLAPDQAGVDR